MLRTLDLLLVGWLGPGRSSQRWTDPEQIHHECSFAQKNDTINTTLPDAACPSQGPPRWWVTAVVALAASADVGVLWVLDDGDVDSDDYYDNDE